MLVLVAVGAVGAGLAYAYSQGYLQPLIDHASALCGCNKDSK